MKILTPEDVYCIDHALQKKHSLEFVIENVAQELAKWAESWILKDHKTLIMVGPGNNGQDALVLGRVLEEKGISVDVLALPFDDKKKINGSNPISLDSVKWEQYQWIVDGLFGVGLDRAPVGEFASAVGAANKATGKIISIDVASGVNCETGEVYEPCIGADHTLMIAAPKFGNLILPGRQFCGELHLVQVPVINEALLKYDCANFTLDDQTFLLSKIKAEKSDHKYSRGVLSFVLCSQYPGAALQAAQAARFSGAGYVQVYSPPQFIEECQVRYPDFVFKPYQDKADLFSQIKTDKSNVLVVGTGWDLGEFDCELINFKKGVVLDGGVLNSSLLKQLQVLKSENYCLTPHQGELRRLLGEAENPKLKALRKLQSLLQGTIVAKGYDTIVAKAEQMRICDWNAPSLATAGSGDVLAGMIGSFMAQGLNDFEASCLAVDLHRRAGSTFTKRTVPSLLCEKILGLVNQDNQ